MEEFFRIYWPYISAGTTAAGAVGAWFVSQMFAVRKIESSERNELLTRIHQYSERQDDRLRERDDQIEKLTKDLIESRFRVAEISKTNVLPIDVVKAVIDADVGLAWANERVGPDLWRMVRVSPGYARLYLGGTSRIYDGKYDAEIWGDELGLIFTQENEHVYASQTGITVRNRVHSEHTGAEGYFIGRKFSLRLSTGEDIVMGSGDHLSLADAKLLFGDEIAEIDQAADIAIEQAKNTVTKKKRNTAKKPRSRTNTKKK